MTNLDLYGWIFRIPFVMGLGLMYLSSVWMALASEGTRALFAMFVLGFIATTASHWLLRELENDAIVRPD